MLSHPSFSIVLSLLIFTACSHKEEDIPATPVAAAAPASTPDKPAAAASPEDRATMVRYTYKESPQKITLPEGRQLPLVDESTIEPKVGEVIVTLTMHLRRFMQEKGHAPESIGQLISSRMDSAPRPPPGTMYVIDARAKEVRLVKIK